MNNYPFGRYYYDFPQQKVSAAEKRKSDWYASCIDFVIDAGLSMTNMGELHDKINILLKEY